MRVRMAGVTGLGLASGALADQVIPFSSGGKLGQNPLLKWVDAQLRIMTPRLDVFNPSAGDQALGIRFGTGDTGDPVDDNHGCKVGLHSLSSGGGGDIPGAAYMYLLTYFGGRIKMGVGNAYKFQIASDGASSGYFTPWDDDSGAAGNQDNKHDLGRYTTSGVGGELYTRKLRFRDVYVAGGMRNGEKNTAGGTYVKLGASAVAIRRGDDVVDADLTAGALTLSGALTVKATAPVAIAPVGSQGFYWQSALAATSAEWDFTIKTVNTRTPASNNRIFGIVNNSTTLFYVDPNGAVFINGDFIQQTATKFGAMGATPVVRPTVSGSRATDAWRTSVMTALVALGLVADTSTA